MDSLTALYTELIKAEIALRGLAVPTTLSHPDEIKAYAEAAVAHDVALHRYQDALHCHVYEETP